MNLSNLNLDELTLENFLKQTGQRFRVTREQKKRIDQGVLTREAAFQEFLAETKAEKAKSEAPQHAGTN